MHKNKKLITVLSGGPLPELHFITGPVFHPWYVDKTTVIQLVNNGRIVFEVNPQNRSERIKLTPKNMRLDNFGTDAETVAKPTPAPATKPVVTEPKEEVKTEVAEEVVVEQVAAPVQETKSEKKESYKKPVTSDFKKK